MKTLINFAGTIPLEWENRLTLLGNFLSKETGYQITISCYKDNGIGGLRIASVRFSKGDLSSLYERELMPLTIFYCEEFLAYTKYPEILESIKKDLMENVFV